MHDDIRNLAHSLDATCDARNVNCDKVGTMSAGNRVNNLVRSSEIQQEGKAGNFVDSPARSSEVRWRRRADNGPISGTHREIAKPMPQLIQLVLLVLGGRQMTMLWAN